MIEWVFFVTILTADVVPETGWQQLERFEFAYPARGECDEAQGRAVAELKPDVDGEGAVTSGCRERRVTIEVVDRDQVLVD